jgi:Na+-driven multidrug efflux pump
MPDTQKINLFSITWPIFIENLLMVLMGLFGLWLTSRISTGAVATYGLVNQILGALQILFRVVSIGTSVVVTQHQGARDFEGARRIARTGLAASTWVGVATLLLLCFGSNWILWLMHLPTELMSVGTPYLSMLGVALLFDAISMSMVAVLRAYTHTRESMRIVLIMNMAQLVLSVPLLLGVGHWAGLGLPGLAMAMLASRLVGIAWACKVWRSRLLIQIRWADWFRLARKPLDEILHIGLPGAGEKVAFRVSFIISIAMVASMGKLALATHTYVFQAVQLVTLFTNSVGFGTEILVGHAVGAGHHDRWRFGQLCDDATGRSLGDDRAGDSASGGLDRVGGACARTWAVFQYGHHQWLTRFGRRPVPGQDQCCFGVSVRCWPGVAAGRAFWPWSGRNLDWLRCR